VPLWPQTRPVLPAGLEAWGARADPLALPSARGRPLSRAGGDSLLHKAVQQAAHVCPSLRMKRMTPPGRRHTTALPLLPSGVDIAVIALWLGHDSMETTPVSLEVDLAHTEQALQTLSPVEGEAARCRADDPLLAFLSSL
jgi:site-specific recombinase XerD